MAENATKLRNQANTVLQQCIRDTNRYIAIPSPSMRLLKQKMDKLNAAIDDLQVKHFTFADKTGADIDSEDLQNWINPKLDEGNVLADKLFVMIDELEQSEESQNLITENNNAEKKLLEKETNDAVILEKQCKITENIIKEKLSKLKEIVDDEDREENKSDQDLVRSYLKEIDKFLEDQTKSWNERKRLYVKEQARLDAVFAEETLLRKAVSDGHLSASAFTVIEEANQDKDAENSKVNSSKLLDIQKMSPPTFNGDIKSFC